jgi:hypothetical protein
MQSKLMKTVRGILGVACAAALAGGLFVQRASAAVIYAIDDQNNLFTFDNLAPQNILTGTFITGLKPNEHLINIDFRPANGLLYGIGSSYQVYTVNPATGAAVAVGAGFGAVPGNSYGMDFNPVPDRIRFFSDNDNNIRIDPNTGLRIVPDDTNLAYAPGDPNAGKNPSVVGAGYTNSTNPAPANTTLYGIDSNLDTLVRVGDLTGAPISPNSGQLFTVGALGVNTDNFVGFDISRNNVAFAALQPTNSSVSRLYAVNLATGATSDQGQIIGGVRVVDIALDLGVDFIVPEPGSILSLSALTLGMGLRRRSRV